MLHDSVVGNGSILPSAAVVLDSVALLGYREPEGLTVFVFVLIPSTWVMCFMKETDRDDMA